MTQMMDVPKIDGQILKFWINIKGAKAPLITQMAKGQTLQESDRKLILTIT